MTHTATIAAAADGHNREPAATGAARPRYLELQRRTWGTLAQLWAVGCGGWRLHAERTESAARPPRSYRGQLPAHTHTQRNHPTQATNYYSFAAAGISCFIDCYNMKVQARDKRWVRYVEGIVFSRTCGIFGQPVHEKKYHINYNISIITFQSFISKSNYNSCVGLETYRVLETVSPIITVWRLTSSCIRLETHRILEMVSPIIIVRHALASETYRTLDI